MLPVIRLVKVCVPAQVLLVVVPKASEIVGVAPPEDWIGYVPVTEVTVPCGCAVHPTTPVELVVRALVPLQFSAAPVMANVVVVALVVVAPPMRLRLPTIVELALLMRRPPVRVRRDDVAEPPYAGWVNASY